MTNVSFYIYCIITAAYPGLSAHKLATTNKRNSEYGTMPHIPCNYTRQEGTKGYWRYSSTHSWPWYSTEKTVQPHAPAALPTRMGPQHQFNDTTQWTPATTQWRLEGQCIMGFLEYIYQWQWQNKRKTSASNEKFNTTQKVTNAAVFLHIKEC